MKLMSYTSAMQQGFVPRLQSMMPQAPQGPSLAGGMLGVGVGQEGNGSLIPTPQGDAGGDALKGLLPQSGPQQTQPGQQPAQPGMGTMRQNVTPDVRGQLRQGIGLETQPAMKAAGGAYA
ncbi:MAG: hypothetical protein KHX83_09275 [Bilophila sp.]|uniref:hypothetical protein n=1 Tax=Bilophila sp. TaxID=1929485 RepID=UPI002580BFE0|nr:hypothetical protein [Bilophila sp.]MBS5455628.1 hypothetical protein [Bilophila sp.]